MMKRLRRYLVAGLLVWLPLGVTVLLFRILIGLMSRQFGDLADFIVTAGEVDGVAPTIDVSSPITLEAYFRELADR